MPDPNKGKKVKGETTTTTSTRRGKQDGKFGTFTDTESNTPYTQNSSKGSPEFNQAFSEARSDGDKSFGFEGKSYNTNLKGNDTSNTSSFAPDKTSVASITPRDIKHMSYKGGKTQMIQVPERKAEMFANTGSNMDNMNFAGSRQSFISSEQRGNSASYEISGSKGENTSTSTRLSDNQADAMRSSYSRGRTTAPSEDLATRMNAKEDARTKKVVKRAQGTAAKMEANATRVAKNKRTYKG